MKGKTSVILGQLLSESSVKVACYGVPEDEALNIGPVAQGGVCIEHQTVGDKETLHIKFKVHGRALLELAKTYGKTFSKELDDPGFFILKESDIKERTLYINVLRNDGGLRKYTFWRCMLCLTPGGPQHIGEHGEGVVEIQFAVLADPSKDNICRFGQAADPAPLGIADLEMRLIANVLDIKELLRTRPEASALSEETLELFQKFVNAHLKQMEVRHEETLGGIMHSVDKWFEDGDPRLQENPTARAAYAREIALQAVEGERAAVLKAISDFQKGASEVNNTSYSQGVVSACTALRIIIEDGRHHS